MTLLRDLCDLLLTNSDLTVWAEKEPEELNRRSRRALRFVNTFWTALFVAWYDFCRKNKALGKNTTPAMASGLTNHVWTLEELLTEVA
jgi:hypothetical protein